MALPTPALMTVDHTRYAQLVIAVLTRLAANPPRNGQIESVLAIDPVRDTYMLVQIGWDGEERIHDVAASLRIKHDKVVVEADNFDPSIFEDLREAGIPDDAMIAGFLPQPH